jgi:hypothetical protein
MKALEAGGTASFVRREGLNAVPNVAPWHLLGFIEGLTERTGYSPTGSRRRWAVWGWDDGSPPMLVDLGATGTTVIDPHNLPQITWQHVPLRLLPADLERTFAEIDALKYLEAGWNGHDVAAPKIEAIHEATTWIERMYDDVVRSELAWLKPHVAADENGEVTFEWWNGDKGLAIYVSPDGGVSYLKDWGPDMLDDMEDGPLATPQERRDLWAWFTRQ